jgi:hypothetical protein
MKCSGWVQTVARSLALSLFTLLLHICMDIRLHKVRLTGDLSMYSWIEYGGRRRQRMIYFALRLHCCLYSIALTLRPQNK